MVRSWVLVTTPVHDGERTIGVSIRVQDVSPLGEKLATVLGEYATLIEQTDRVSTPPGTVPASCSSCRPRWATTSPSPAR